MNRENLGQHNQTTSSSLTDGEIIIRILDGETPLFELIMRRYNRLLFRLARGIVPDDVEAEDVVQEAYVKAYLNLGQFRGPTGFPTWLSRITCNEALTRVRKTSRIQTITLDQEESQMNVVSLAQREFEHENPEHTAMTHEALGLVEKAIEQLPKDFRVVFMLRGIEQLSVAETANYLDINPITVKTRFHRARKQIQTYLRQHFEDQISEAFPFAGQRCDQIVKGVFERLADLDIPQK